MEIFLDNSSTTKAMPEVIGSMVRAMRSSYGNASSFHVLGISSEKIVRDASDTIMGFIGAKKGKIYFTSCGTEANNLAIFGGINPKEIKNITTSSIEHASVDKPIKKLQKEGTNVSLICPDSNFKISDSALDECIAPETKFISVMHVNNEVGMVFPLDKISKIRAKKCPKAVFHVDAVQSFGKFHIDVDHLKIDFLSMSAHKIHGPKGMGALYSSGRVRLNPIFLGGSQQNGIRPGTYPVELISGFRTAVEICNIDDRFEIAKKLNRYCRLKLLNIKDIRINSPDDSSPYILNFSVLGLKSEVLLNFLSDLGIYVSSASACSGNARSRVLSAVGLENSVIDSAIRVSFSCLNSTSDIDHLIDAIIDAKNVLLHS